MTNPLHKTNTKRTLSGLLFLLSFFFFSIEAHTQDNDSDGVLDSADLDDDNDGILDSEECGISSLVFGSNLTVNAGFESGNTGFTSDNAYFGDCTGGGSQAPNSYSVLNGNANDCNSGWSATASEGTYFGIFDFPSTNIQQNFWCQTLSLNANTEYYFSADFINVLVLSDETDPIFGFYVTNENTGTTTNLGQSDSQISLTENSGWQEAGFTFTTESTGANYTICLRNISYGHSGNDAGMDNIQLRSATCDTDNDGITNDLDTDSDNDGCSDAEEGLGSFSYTNGTIQNDTLTGGVETNGVPTAAGAGQGIGDAQNASVQSCVCPYASGIDSDGDGVDDVCDLDNDNDGILDTEECTYNVRNCMDWDGTNDYNARSGTIVDALTGNTVTISFTAALWNYDFYSTPSGASSINGKAGVDDFCNEFTGVIGNDGDIITFAFSAPVSNPTIQISSMGATSNPATHTLFADGRSVDLVLNTIHSESTDLSPVVSGNTIIGAEAVIEYTVPGVYSTVELLVNTASSDAYMFSLVSVACDSDNDGIVNDLDLDSDNDGCSDAEEGTGSFTINQGSIENDTLTGGVGSNGVPTLAGGGQGLGDAQNNATQSCACTNATGADSDGDGIDNFCDLDSDNDGISDENEGACASASRGEIIVNTQSSEIASYNLDDGSTSILCTTSFQAGDIAMTTDGSTFYLARFTNAREIYSVDASTCSEQLLGTITAGSGSINALSMLPDGSLLVGLTTSDIITRITSLSPFTQEVWATGMGTSAGDFVTADGFVFFASNDGTYKITIDGSYNFVSAVNLGHPGETTYGMTISQNCQPIYGANNQLSVITNITEVTSGNFDQSTIATDVPGLGSIWGLTSVHEGTDCTCIDLDTDSDGIPDFVDLDSDNDGCSDAEEGAGNFSYVNNDIQNDTLTGGIGSNGIPAAAGSGQGIGSARDASIQSCDCPNASGIDSDGDGIDNVCDLDDDNDGILDIDECPSTNHALSGTAAQSSNYNGTLLAANINDGNTDYPEAHSGNGSPNEWIEIDMGTEVQMDELVIYNRTNCCQDRLSNVFVMISNNPFPSNTNLTESIENASYIDQIGDVAGINKINLSIGKTARYIRLQKSGTNPGGDYINLYEIQVLEYGSCNTDGDGLTNLLDTDSDGDGCPDALEGGGGFTKVNVQNDTLIGGIDANGIPAIATASGQAIGSAQDENTLAAACNVSSRAANDFNNTPYDTPVSGDVSTNDTDEEGDNQSFTLSGANGGMNVAEGSVTFNSDGSYTFTPASGFTGGTSFSYSLCDDGVPSICDTAIVYVEVFPEVNPETTIVVANPDVHNVKTGQTGSGNVMSNDLDPDDLNPAVTTTMTNATVSGIDEDGNTVADAGTLTLNADGSYTFVPTGVFTGTITQSYTICNATAPAVCDNAILVIEVLADNGNTTFINDDAVVTDAGVTATGDVSTNDDDNEGDDQSVSTYMHDTDGDGDGDTPGTVGAATQVGGTNDMGVFVANAGSLILNSDGTYNFVPATGFFGNVNIPYTACDDNSSTVACGDATLVVTVVDVKRDYGDAPAAYPAAWHRAMTDSNSDDVLDGTTDVWLGTNTSFEVSQLTNASANGDTNDDAMSFGAGSGQFPLSGDPSTSYDVDITVNSTGADLVFYGMWIDWDNDGTYEDFYSGSAATSSPAVATVSITTPATTGGIVNVRLRADDDPFTMADYQGGRTNGEVEDYQATVALPVELLSFKATPRECSVVLDWSTASEENFSHYEVERSEDGTDFRTLDNVMGSEYSVVAKYYTYLDKQALKTNYYRLKMVDMDGSYEYSNIVYTETKCNVSDITIFPNPVSKNGGSINVNFLSNKEEAIFEISDMLGRVFKRTSMGVEVDAYNTVILDVSDLPTGTYTLRLEGEKVSKIFIVQE